MLITSLSIITTIMFTYTYMFFASKILNIKMQNNIKNLLIITALSIIIVITNKFDDTLMKTLIQFFLYNITVSLIFKKEIDKSIICTILAHLVIFVYDIFGILILKIFNFDINSYGIAERKIIGDIIVIVIILIASKISPIVELLQSIINNSKVKIIYYISILILSIAVGYTFVYYNIINKTVEEMVINTSMIGLIVFIFIKLSLDSASKQNIVKEYEKMNEYVKVYEDIIEKDRIQRHENKNQLITIKGMISKRDKKTHEYIDSLVQDNNDMTNRWVGELKNIPIGGLKGLLFYKVNKMRNSGIEANVTISRMLENSKLQDIDTKTYKQLCQIIGVYIDNAIEACLEADVKSIGIEIYKENDIFEFIISNTYNGTINIDNMDEAGYTTKGNGHGYGLSLVRDIINSNAKFFQNREIINDYYIQHLFLDLTE